MKKIDDYFDVFIEIIDEIARKTKKTKVQYDTYTRYQHEFLLKIYCHVFSLKTLWKGYSPVTEDNVVIKDFSGISVIMRSVLETYLIFNYIYIDPKNKALSQLRYRCWEREGLLSRQKIKPNVTDVEMLQQLASDKVLIDGLTDTITRSEYYPLLEIRNKKKFIDNGSWHPSFNKLIMKTTLIESTKEFLYSFFI